MKYKWDEASEEREKLITNLFGPHQIREIIQARTAFFSPYLWNPDILFPSDMPTEYDFDSARRLWRRVMAIFGAVVSKANYSEITYEAVIRALGEWKFFSLLETYSLCPFFADPAQIPL
jgi:hypothetical protein